MQREHRRKEREKAIVLAVYGVEWLAELTPTERPDFVLRAKSGTASFGVEVTEFYFSESNARLTIIPNYALEILQRRAYRHKADAKALPVEKVTYHSPDRQIEREIEGIWQEVPDIRHYSDNIAALVTHKSAKLAAYQSSLDHVSLIVLDRERYPEHVGTPAFQERFLTPQMAASIRASGYREVYLITGVEDERWVYIPLGLLTLISEACCFGRVVASDHDGLCTSSWEALVLFGMYLRQSTGRPVFLAEGPDGNEMLYRGYSMTANGKKINYRDLVQCSPPGEATPLKVPPDRASVVSSLVVSMDKFRKKRRFTGSLALDVKGRVPGPEAM